MQSYEPEKMCVVTRDLRGVQALESINDNVESEHEQTSTKQIEARNRMQIQAGLRTI